MKLFYRTLVGIVLLLRRSTVAFGHRLNPPCYPVKLSRFFTYNSALPTNYGVMYDALVLFIIIITIHLIPNELYVHTAL